MRGEDRFLPAFRDVGIGELEISQICLDEAPNLALKNPFVADNPGKFNTPGVSSAEAPI